MASEALTLFDPAPETPTKASGWGVEVNEIKILTYTGTTEDAVRRWILWRSRMDRTDRIKVLNGLSIAGELVHVACDDRDDAQQAMEMFEGWGIHKSALKVKRLANEPGAGKTSVKVNHDPPRSLEEQNATDAAAEGIDLSSASATSTGSAGLSRTSPDTLVQPRGTEQNDGH